MKTLKLTKGDLTIYAGGYEMVTGPAKIVQDLRCALLEPLGNDRFHPGYGSILQNFIGGLASPSQAYYVRQEISRVVQNYVAVQQDLIARDLLMGKRSRFHSADVISRVDSIDVIIKEDGFYVTITFTTRSGIIVTTTIS